jgi:hypothetical protein
MSARMACTTYAECVIRLVACRSLFMLRGEADRSERHDTAVGKTGLDRPRQPLDRTTRRSEQAQLEQSLSSRPVHPRITKQGSLRAQWRWSGVLLPWADRTPFALDSLDREDRDFNFFNNFFKRDSWEEGGGREGRPWQEDPV